MIGRSIGAKFSIQLSFFSLACYQGLPASSTIVRWVSSQIVRHAPKSPYMQRQKRLSISTTLAASTCRPTALSTLSRRPASHKIASQHPRPSQHRRTVGLATPSCRGRLAKSAGLAAPTHNNSGPYTTGCATPVVLDEALAARRCCNRGSPAVP